MNLNGRPYFLRGMSLKTVEEIREFLSGTTTFDFEPQSREETYRWIQDMLRPPGRSASGPSRYSGIPVTSD